MKRHPGYAAINILGLSLGLVVSFVILLWVQDELAYDGFHKDVQDVYQVMRTADFGGDISTTDAITAELDKVLDEEYPEIEYVSLLSWEKWSSFVRGDLAFRNMNRHVGPDFFRILTFEMYAGDPFTALDNPESVVLSEKMARNFFPEEFATHNDVISASQSILGQTLMFENRLEVTVTGVVENAPDHSSIKYDALLPYEEYARTNSWVKGWDNNGFRMIARLIPGADPAAVTDKIRMVVKEHDDSSTAEIHLQALTERYLWSNWKDGVLIGGRVDYVRIMGIVGILILLIAAINFTNLATAQSSQRAMEIGIRKAFGGSRKGLAGQFLFESVFTACLAFGVAVAATWGILPGLNNLTGKAIQVGGISLSTWVFFFGITVFTGLLAGSYPAAFLSRLGIMKVLRSRSSSGSGSGALRRLLVVFQFSISILLIVGTMTIYKQLHMIQTRNLGFDRENIVIARLEGGARAQFDSFKAKLKESPAILDVTQSDNNSPYDINTSTSDPSYEGKIPDDNALFYMVATGYDYLKTFKMELVAGRDFSMDQGLDSANVIINETTARKLGFEDPIGQKFSVWGREGTIIGVVKDFHMRSMYAPISSVIIRLSFEEAGLYVVRTAAGKEAEAVAAMKSAFAEFSPGYPFNERFMDDEYNEMYRSEQVIGTLANWFAVLAIVIACMGLYGLASFTTTRRTKEIGVRKVLGASTGNVVMLLTKEFALMVGIAFLLAAPTAWWLMSKWLQDFEYKVNLGVGLFLLAGLGMVVITYATVGLQSMRAALANPADALRSE